MEKEKLKSENSIINDLPIRLIGIPAFGIIIPNIAGLFGHYTFEDFTYWWGYLFFVFISFSIWHGNRWLLFKQRQHFDWFDKPVIKVVWMIFAIIFYTAPLTISLCLLWYNLAGFAFADWEAIQKTTMMNVIAVIFITHIYETVFLIKERESDLIRFEKLERAKAQAELEVLRNQIDPHFMFNSLNTLSFLIENDSPKALLFNENLADVYRYILINKNKELVQLKDELDFLSSYYSLLKIRFGDSIYLAMERGIVDQNYLLPPVSVQTLIENAVKHNQFDEEIPLQIEIHQEKSYLKIANNKRVKEQEVKSSKTGLINLHERFKLITQKDIEIIEKEHTFTVYLPLLEIKS